MKVGVLALQGAFAKHIEMICLLGHEGIEVRKAEDLALCDGLIIPGGESTTMFYHIDFMQLSESLKAFAQKKPVFGTCAGLILMAREIRGQATKPFGFLDVEVERNAFGRQAESFTAQLKAYKPLDEKIPLVGVFIRAPRLVALGEGVQVLAELDGEPVIVQQGRFIGAACHPELTDSTLLHQHFLKLVAAC